MTGLTAGEATTELHHVGVTVADMSRSLAFWRDFMGAEATTRRTANAEFLGTLVGRPGAELEIAWLDLDGALALELVAFVGSDDESVESSPPQPGTVHLCLGVADLDEAIARGLAAGAEQVSFDPIEIPAGPNEGARHVYLRDPDGILIELRQPPPAR
jgi:catechol 2,3-dioxygenase-like lactoylglutathione lyase family enzyme